jgi:hypothetical protein
MSDMAKYPGLVKRGNVFYFRRRVPKPFPGDAGGRAHVRVAMRYSPGTTFFKTVNDPYSLSTYRLNNLYRTDLQRTDRSSMANSIECRVPFLDRPKIRMPEGIGIHDRIFSALADVQTSDMILPDIVVDGPQIRNALKLSLNSDTRHLPSATRNWGWITSRMGTSILTN